MKATRWSDESTRNLLEEEPELGLCKKSWEDDFKSCDHSLLASRLCSPYTGWFLRRQENHTGLGVLLHTRTVILARFLVTGRSCAAPIECFHSRGQRLCKFIGTRESVCITKEFNSQRIGLGHQHGRRFIVLGHQYGRRDVMWKHSMCFTYRIVSVPHFEQVFWP